jgi:hypothetical protein
MSYIRSETMSLTLADVPGVLTEAELGTLVKAETDSIIAGLTLWNRPSSYKARILAAIARMKEFAEAIPDPQAKAV